MNNGGWKLEKPKGVFPLFSILNYPFSISRYAQRRI